MGKKMNCWHCNTELIWGGDHDYEAYGLEGEGIVSNLSCPKCPTTLEVYYNTDEENDKCNHKGEYQEEESENNVPENYICKHCGINLPMPNPECDL